MLAPSQPQITHPFAMLPVESGLFNRPLDLCSSACYYNGTVMHHVVDVIHSVSPHASPSSFHLPLEPAKPLATNFPVFVKIRETG
jgi:hypothetical protein